MRVSSVIYHQWQLIQSHPELERKTLARRIMVHNGTISTANLSTIVINKMSPFVCHFSSVTVCHFETWCDSDAQDLILDLTAKYHLDWLNWRSLIGQLKMRFWNVSLLWWNTHEFWFPLLKCQISVIKKTQMQANNIYAAVIALLLL